MIKLSHLKKWPLLPSHQDDGIIMVTVMVAASALFIISLSLLSAATSQSILTGQSQSTNNATLAAEAGIEQTIQDLSTDDDTPGYTDQPFFDNTAQGQGYGTFTVTITPSGANKTLTATGKVYTNSSKTKLLSQRTVRTTAVSTPTGGHGIHAGAGGLTMSGTSNIDDSDVYINGTINMSGASNIGSPAKPTNVNVANYACPSASSPGSTYPQLCGGGAQPVTMQAPYGSRIYGTVCATGQTSGSPTSLRIMPGTGPPPGEGLKLGCVAPRAPLASYDRDKQVSQVVPPIKPSSYDCGVTWGPNMQITGPVTVNNGCIVTIKGNVYIKGDLTINSAGGLPTVKVDPSVTKRPVILVDGAILIGNVTMLKNSSGIGLQFISFKSSDSCTTAYPSCNKTPCSPAVPGFADCVGLSGNTLKTSQALQTVRLGGVATTEMSGMSFYAYWGLLNVFTNKSIGSITGQAIAINASGSISYGDIGNGGPHTWGVKTYQQIPSP